MTDYYHCSSGSFLTPSSIGLTISGCSKRGLDAIVSAAAPAGSREPAGHGSVLTSPTELHTKEGDGASALMELAGDDAFHLGQADQLPAFRTGRLGCGWFWVRRCPLKFIQSVASIRHGRPSILPPVIGLRNGRNRCFAHSVIQLLLSIDVFRTLLSVIFSEADEDVCPLGWAFLKMSNDLQASSLVSTSITKLLAVPVLGTFENGQLHCAGEFFCETFQSAEYHPYGKFEML